LALIEWSRCLAMCDSFWLIVWDKTSLTSKKSFSLPTQLKQESSDINSLFVTLFCVAPDAIDLITYPFLLGVKKYREEASISVCVSFFITFKACWSLLVEFNSLRMDKTLFNRDDNWLKSLTKTPISSDFLSFTCRP